MPLSDPVLDDSPQISSVPVAPLLFHESGHINV